MNSMGKGLFISSFISVIGLLLLGSPASAADIAIRGDSTDIGNIIVVTPKPGDKDTDNGAALLNTLNGITGNDENNRYFIKLGPGIYNIQANSLQMKQYVSIEGSGEEATTITAAISSAASPPTAATVKGSNNTGLRFLTVVNTGTGAYTTAILNSSASPSMMHVTAAASGGNTYNYGVYNNSSSSPPMSNVTATASGENALNYGIYNYSYSSPPMTNVTATASGENALNYGIYNYSYSSPKMSNVTATASGGDENYGVYNSDSVARMTNVVATGKDGGLNYGLYNYAIAGTYWIYINRSSFEGNTNSIYNDADYTLFIGASNLTGGAVNTDGTWHCITSYDGDTLMALDDLCQ